MKNNIYKTIGLLAIFLVTLNTIAQQDRNVIWIHGLGGGDYSLQHYKTIFDAEIQINSLRLSYNTDDGIVVAANDVLNSVDTFVAESTNPQNLAIGHSMRGLMIRDVDRRTTNKRFGGYITLTSPIYGAPISNSIFEDLSFASFNVLNIRSLIYSTL